MCMCDQRIVAGFCLGNYSVVCLYTPMSSSVPEMESVDATGGHPFFQGEPVWPSGKVLGW